MLPDAETKFSKALNSGEEEGWSPFLVLVYPKMGFLNDIITRYLQKRVQITPGTLLMNDSFGNIGKPSYMGFLRQIYQY